MTDCFLGEIRLFGGAYAPEDWALCDGSSLAIRTYPDLYSLIGTTYGGDGVNTFRLPDFRGRVVVGQGQMGSSNSNFALGQSGGTETVTLTVAQIPAHNHKFNALNTPATTSSPVNTMLAVPQPVNNTQGLYMATTKAGAVTQVADPNFLDYTGGAASGGASQAVGDPHQNMMPFLSLNYIISLHGAFPIRA
jgi:microcystin-dependent protein